MELLAGKSGLIFGVANERSYAWHIARALIEHGAQCAFGCLPGEKNEARTRFAADALGIADPWIRPCDVSSDAQIGELFAGLKQRWDGLDGLVHAIAFAPREAIAGELLDGLSREAFREAHDISSYSFPALAKAALPMMQGRPAALLTLTYLGAERVVPHYNVMGLAKASLEASVRYLASNLGAQGIRVNGISAGPIKTLAASGISGFSRILKFVEQHAPLRRNVTIEDVGNAAAFLLSDLAAGITGEIVYVDAGFSSVVGGMTAGE